MEDKKKLLLIDDEGFVRHALSEKIKHEGIEVTEANGGVEGVELALELKPDLILLDIIMPDLDGWGVLQQLRADEWGKSAQVILLSILNDEESTMKALEFGVNEFIVKTDWRIDQVATRVKEKLGIKE
jgi:PleD family two-component response regulator